MSATGLTIRSSSIADRWLQNFDASDRQYAAIILDSLIPVSISDFQKSIQQKIEEISHNENRPLALFSAREPEENPYFNLTDCSERPNAVGSGAKVGSEGVVANVIRDMSAHLGNRNCLDHPSIHSMRATKLRHLVFVDDFIGSGNRILGFYKWLFEHPTLSSWRSYGFLKISVVCHCCTDYGFRTIGKTLPKTICHYSRLLERGRLFWSDTEREEITRICYRYADRTGRPYFPLGYRKQFTFTIYEHKCPNTTPAIIWAKSKYWKPLVDPRPQLSFDQWPQDVEEEERIRRALLVLGQKKLSVSDMSRYASPEARLRFVILSAVAKGYGRTEKIYQFAEVSPKQGDALLAECRRFGWVSTDLRVTQKGLGELHRAKSMQLLRDKTPQLTDGIYVPKSFRGSSGTI